jgi:fucose permease
MRRSSPWLLLALAYVGFLSLGLPDGLLGVAWPEMRARFALPQGALGGLLATATAGYVAASFAAGWLLRRMRIGGLLALSCLATAASLLGYASAPAWLVVVAWGAFAGLGAGAIDAGINAYVASHHSARTVNWLHACYGIGAAAGPALMSAVIARGLGWERGYLLVGCAQLALAAAFAATYGRWPPIAARTPERPGLPTGETLRATLRVPSARWGGAAFFVYTGIEAGVGAWSYSLLTLGRGFAMEVAAFWVSAFWIGLTAGRVLTGALAHALPAERILQLALLALVTGTALVWLAPIRGAELVGLALVGLACGPIFPTLIATTPRRVGAGHAANTVGVQIAAAALGQSTLPAALGLLAGAFGLEVIGPCLVLAVIALALILGRVRHSAPAQSAPSTPSSVRRTFARARWSRTR